MVPTEEVDDKEQTIVDNNTEPVVFNQMAVQEIDRPTFSTGDVFHKDQMIINQTAFQQLDRPTFPTEVFHKEHTTLDNNAGHVVLNRTAVQEQHRQTLTLLGEIFQTEPTSPRVPSSSTMKPCVFRNSSRSAYTTHSYEEMVSENAPVDKLEAEKWFENNKQDVCVIVKGLNQNATVKSIECVVPKAFQTSLAALLSFCQISLKKWKVIGFLGGSCSGLDTEMIKRISRLVQSGRLFTIEKNAVFAMKLICLTGKKAVGNMYFVNVCPMKEGLIPPSDRLRISKYLQKTCNIPEAVITTSNVKFVDKMSQCSNFIKPQGNSEYYLHTNYAWNIGLVVLIISIIGIFANSAAISVLANGGLEQTKKSKSTMYLLIMLSNGLFTLVFSLLLTLVMLKFMSPLPFGWCHLIYATRNFAFFGSSYSILLVTIERYIVICHPLKAQSILTQSFQRTVRIIIYLFYVNLRSFLAHFLVELENDHANISLENIVVLVF